MIYDDLSSQCERVSFHRVQNQQQSTIQNEFYHQSVDPTQTCLLLYDHYVTLPVTVFELVWMEGSGLIQIFHFAQIILTANHEAPGTLFFQT